MSQPVMNLRLLAFLLSISSVWFLLVKVSDAKVSLNFVAQPVADQLSDENLHRVAQAITVKVLSREGRGSGTLIKRVDGTYTVLTSAHTLISGGPFRIQTPEGQRYAAEVVKEVKWKGIDLALLQFRSTYDYQVATLETAQTPAVNEPVFSAGFPFDREQIIFSRGQVTLLPNQALKRGYQIGYSNSIQQGMSGGPLLNRQGKLVGINGIIAYPILNNAYVFSDDSLPNTIQLEKMRSASWGIPTKAVVQFAPQFTLGDLLLKSEKAQTFYAQAKQDDNVSSENNTFPSASQKKSEARGGVVSKEFIEKINQTAQTFTVRIEWFSNDRSQVLGQGSGVIIANRDGTYYVLTNEHVVHNEGIYELTAPDGKRYSIDYRTVRKPKTTDLAVLQFKSDTTYQVATLADVFADGRGYIPLINPVLRTVGVSQPSQSIFVAGWSQLRKDKISAPFKANWHFYWGTLKRDENRLFDVQDHRSLLRGYQLVYSNPTHAGMSGGPVLDPDARVIGIHGQVEGGYIKDGGGNITSIDRGSSLGVPVKKVLSLITELGVKREWLNVETTLPSAIVAVSPDWLSKNDRGLDRIENPGWDIQFYDNTRISTWLNRGNTYWRLGNREEASNAFYKAIETNPKSPDAWYGRAFILRESGKFDEALAAIDQAILLEPKSDRAYRLRGLILLGNRRKDKGSFNNALAAFDKVLEIRQKEGDKIKDAQLSSWRGVIYYFLGQYKDAFNEFSQALEVDSFAICYCMRGDARSELGDFKGAVEDYTKAIDLLPDPGAYIGRAYAYTQLKKYEQAIKDYTSLLELSSKFHLNMGGDGASSDFLLKRGVLYAEIKDFRKAIKDFDEVISIRMIFFLPKAHYQRGRIKALSGDRKGAIADLTEALKLYSKYSSQKKDFEYQKTVQLFQQLQSSR